MMERSVSGLISLLQENVIYQYDSIRVTKVKGFATWDSSNWTEPKESVENRTLLLVRSKESALKALSLCGISIGKLLLSD